MTTFTRKEAKMIAEELYKLLRRDVQNAAGEALENCTDEDWLSTSQAAEYLGLSAVYVKKHIAEIPHVKVGRLNRFTKRSLDAWAKRP